MSLLPAACGPRDCGRAYEKGSTLYQEGKFSEALTLLIPIAEDGYGPAINIVGLAYEHGEGVGRSEEEAVRWFKTGAENGDELCAFNLAGMYLHGGLSVRQDYPEAAKWYKHAIEKKSSAMAMHGLGVMNERGLGMPENRRKAVALYTSSAEQCYAPALFELERLMAGRKELAVAGPGGLEVTGKEALPRLPLLKERCFRPKDSRDAEFQLGGGSNMRDNRLMPGRRKV